MLINFSVSNFASFKNKVTLSMEKTAIQQHPEHILDKRVLSGVALYGANASGKTNLLRAIGFVPMFAYPNSVLQLNALNSFMQQSDVPTEFEIEFESNGVNYIYKISFDSKEILSEEISFAEKTKRNLIFKRTGLNAEYGKKFQTEWYKNRTCPKDVTLMSKILSDGIIDNKISGYQHFVNIDEFLRGIAFFDPKTEVPAGYIYNGFKEPQFKKFLKGLLRQADTGITDVDLTELPPATPEQIAKDPDLSRLLPGHALIRQYGDDYYVFTAERGTIRVQRLTTMHGDVSFTLSKESAGTIKLFKLGFLLYSYKNMPGSKLLLLDEFDGLFHPFLTKVLLKSLLNNHMGGQFIAALHNTMLLSHDIWRVDEIWFTEKDEDGASDLYPLTDINPRFDKDLEKDYINGRYGAVPFLGDEKAWEEIVK
ncbi:MAG: ATP-binding protein [Alphaproteobacteria bacterium]|nr:ATP-binding protein [Alphaproteobacteria bacterium]